MKCVIEDKPRGSLSEATRDSAGAVLGRKLTEGELRLMPYLIHCAMDQQPVERAKVTPDEKEILKDWTERGVCRCYPFNVPVAATKEFWRFMVDAAFEGYVLELPGGGDAPC